MSTSKTYQQSLADAGSETRPPMLERGSYIPWASRFRRYINRKRENQKWLNKALDEGDALLHYDAEIEVMNLILLSIPNDIYNFVDACTSAKDMWKRVERLMRGTIQNQVDRETRFTNEFDQFVAEPGEALVSQFEKLVNASRAKKLEKSHDPLALVAHTGLFSRNISSYYVTHPTSVVDYNDEYQQDVVQTNSEDPLASAMLNQAIIQGDRVNIQSRNSGNTRRNTRRAYVQEEVVEGSNTQNDTGNMKTEVLLTDEQNDFLFADASRMEEIEELSANICLMARIQPANNTSDAGPSYDSAFISEYDDQIDSNIIFDEPNGNVNSGSIEKDTHLELYKEMVRVLENINGDNNYLNEFLEADRKAKHFNQQAQSQFVRDRDIIRDLEKQRDKLDLAVNDYKRKNEELQKTHLILKRQMSENEDRYHDTILDLEAKLKKNVDLILKLGNSLQGIFMLRPKPLSVYDSQLKHGLEYPNPYILKQAIYQCPKLYLASSLSNSEILLNVRDTKDTLDDASKKLFAEQKYFPSSFIPSDKTPNATSSIPASMPTSIFYTSPEEIQLNDFCQDQVKPIVNELQFYFEFFRKLFQRDIKEMKDVFESTESELCEIKKQNNFLKDQVLEASLKHEVEISVLLNHECEDNSLHAEIEQVKKNSIEIQEGFQAKINILEKDVQRCQKQSVNFELQLQHEKEKHKWESTLKNKNTNPLDCSWISKIEKLENENVSLDFKVQSLIKECDNVKLEYQKLFDSIKKTRSQTQKEMNELIAHVSEKTYAFGVIRAENQNLLSTISELKTRLETVEKGKSVNTKFDKTNVSQNLLCVTPINKQVFQKKTVVSKNKDRHVVSKPVTLQTSPDKQKGANSNKNVIASGIVRRQMNKDSHVKNSVLANSKNSAKKVAVYVRKNKQTDDTSTNVISNKENVIDVNVANASKAKTLLCVSCMQNMLIPCHDKCLSNYKLNVHSNVRTAFTTNSRSPKSSDTTYVVLKTRFSKKLAQSKSLDTTSVVSKPKIDVGIRFGNDNFAAITGYGDYIQGNITICHVYYVKGLGHNLFSVGKFCDGDLEVAFRSKTCYVRNLEGDDLLTGGRESNLYTISISDMAASSPVCLILDLVDGLPKFKYGKDHLCSACERGKGKKASHPPKLVPSDHSKLELLHMDLCRPIRVASINGKKYILVIVDDYSRYTWVYFLHSKDETLEIIKKFIAQAQLNYKAKVCKIRTDNDHEAPPIETTSDEQTSPLSLTEADEFIQEASADFDGSLEFISYNPPSDEEIESSTAALEPSNVQNFHQVHSSTHIRTKDHLLDQVIGDLSKPVMTRQKL
ncbi:integrase, catalytic region, zinc finger, CCHC-type containing protein [Tanacetum coccineum]